MKCFYINLDKEFTRRANIENNFLDNKIEGWSLNRYPAIGIDYIKENNIKGIQRDGPKACYLSHKYLIKENINSQSPIFILEDDAMFGKNTCKILNDLFAAINFEWDILFTDVCVPYPEQMIKLIRMRKVLSKKNNIIYLNLSEFIFAGTTAYIINPKSIKKILNLIDVKSIDIPIDLLLRKLIADKKLKGFVTFPFITTISQDSCFSQTQPNNNFKTDYIWNLFRQMIWLERNVDNIKLKIKMIDDEMIDENSKIYSTIISACISEKFTPH